MKKARIISLFDGMACGYLAMLGAGIEIVRYVAFEIDKYAVKTSYHNFPMIEHRGDVFQADFTEFSGFDFVLAGFPCTKFSIAQKNDRETEPYSGEGWLLFEQAWRAVCEAKPKFFIFENNKSMAKAVQAEISRIIGFEPICINSALVSAQNRQRLYWVGKLENGVYRKVRVDQPEDRGILLKDILVGATDREKGRCLLSSQGRTTTREYFDKNQGTMAYEPVCPLKSEKGRCLTASYANKGAKHILESNYSDNPAKQQWDSVAEPVGCAYRGRMEDGKWVKRHEAREDEKANALTTAQTDSMVSEPIRIGSGIAIPCEWDESGKPTKAVSAADGKTYTIFEVKDGQIIIKGKSYPIKLVDGLYIIRKLNVTECKRLQTVPEWYEFPVSDSQAYKMLGNGWTVEVIIHLINATQADAIEDEEQLDMFKMMGVL